jgi:transposase
MSSYEIKHLNHLGLVAGFCSEIGLVDYINEQFPNQVTDKPMSYGHCLQAMILNGLGFTSQTLYLQSDFFKDKPCEKLLGKGIQPKHINDAVLGRSLDKFYEFGVSKLYMGLAEKVVEHLGLDISCHHLDSTSFHVDGDYKNTNPNAIQLVQGYSRDHRPELNQAILNLLVENQAGIPLYMKPASGNSNDKEGFNKIITEHLHSFKSAQNNPYTIMDAAGYIADNLQYMHKHNRYMISRVPHNIKEAKDCLQSVDIEKMSDMDNGYKGQWHDSDYADVPQQWLITYSEQAYKREKFTLDKNMHKQFVVTQKSFKKLMSQSFSCETDAKTQLEKWQKKQKYQQVCDVTIKAVGHYSKKGKPKKGQPFDYFKYYIEGNLFTSIEQRQSILKTKGLFIIATNDVRKKLSMKKLLTLYKSQQNVEKGFRFLKNPEFLTSSFYLKKPERIEALLMMMTCCLMVYAGLEHKIRQGLKENNLFIKNQKKKEYQTPTARWVFFCFTGIDTLSIDKQPPIMVNIEERHRIIVKVLGSPYQKLYS